MITLDATTKSLEIVLAGAVTTTQLPFVVSYGEVLNTDQSVSALSESDGQTNDATAVPMVAAPASGHARIVKSFTVYNADSVNAIATVRINNGGTFRIIVKVTLASGDSLVYDEGGFGIVGGVNTLTLPLTVANGGTGDVTLTNHGVLLGQGTSPITPVVGGTGTVLHGNTGGDPNFGPVALAADVSGLLPVANGGTGVGTLTGLVKGTGTSALTAVTAPAGAVVGDTDTQTLTNKWIKPRVTSIASSATPTINTDVCDFVDITALAAAITSMTTNLSGTPVNGQKLIIRFKDNGTARAISWGASFEACGAALPTTTVISKRLTVGLIYDTTTAKWGCVASVQEA